MGTSMRTLSYYVIKMLTCGVRVDILYRKRLLDGVLICLNYVLTINESGLATISYTFN